MSRCIKSPVGWLVWTQAQMGRQHDITDDFNDRRHDHTGTKTLQKLK